MANAKPTLIVGCGRLGSAIVEGWLDFGGVRAEDLLILSPSQSDAADRAVSQGARLNPSHEDLAQVGTVLLAVKPAIWKSASQDIVDHLASDAAVVSVMAGVRTATLASVFGGRPLARVMPTTGVAHGGGVAAIWSADDAARETARALFGQIADVVDLDEERMMDAATAVAGSGPAYILAFVQAMSEAGVKIGLERPTATRLARGALRSAAAAAQGEKSLEDVIGQIASPGGTTRAGLDAQSDAGGEDAAEAAITAALRRARELSRD